MSRRPRKHLTRLVPTLTDSMPWHVWNRFPGSLSRHPMTQRDGSSDPVQPFGSKTQADSNVRFLHNLSDILVYKLSCSWNMCAIVYIYVQYKYMYVLSLFVSHFCMAQIIIIGAWLHQITSPIAQMWAQITRSHPFWHRGYCTQESWQHSSAKTCVAVLSAMNGL